MSSSIKTLSLTRHYIYQALKTESQLKICALNEGIKKARSEALLFFISIYY